MGRVGFNNWAFETSIEAIGTSTGVLVNWVGPSS